MTNPEMVEQATEFFVENAIELVTQS